MQLKQQILLPAASTIPRVVQSASWPVLTSLLFAVLVSFHCIDLRLEKSYVKYDVRKFSFTNRVVCTLDSLPDWVVSINTAYTFQKDID